MNTIKYTLILTFLGASFSLWGQVSVDQYLDLGIKNYQDHNYSAALSHFNEAYMLDNDRADVLYNLGNAAKEQFDFDLAEAVYMRLLDTLQNTDYSDAEFDLAQIKFYQGDYQLAINHFDLYLSQHQDDDPNKTRLALLGKESATWAMTQTKSDIATITRLGDEVNTPYSEHGAFMLDESTIAYTTQSVAFKKDKHKPKRVLSKIAVSSNNTSKILETATNFNTDNMLTSSASVSEDGKHMIYSLCDYQNDGTIRCDLYHATMDASEKWSQGTILPRNINDPSFTTTQPNIAGNWDGTGVLYFSSNRPGTKGGYDIWKSEFDSNMNFKDPQNLSFNTQDDDVSPFYSLADNALYFSSNGRIGMGGFDVYSFDLSENVVSNIGADINTSYNEIYYSNDINGNILFSSNRPGSAYVMEKFETCCYDIYKAKEENFDLNLLALIFDEETAEPLEGATVTLVNSCDKSILDVMLTQIKANDFLYSIDPDCNYVLKIKREGYMPKTVAFLAIASPIRELLTVEEKVYLTRNSIVLNVNTFDASSRRALSGATVKLIDITAGNVLVKTFTNTSGNDFSFSVEPCKSYKLVAVKSGYEEELARIDVPCDATQEMSKDIYLNKTITIETLAGLIPLRLYFDNDFPNPKTMRKETQKSYTQTYERYISRKGEFMRMYSKKEKGNNKIIAENEVSSFFMNDVEAEYNKLHSFMGILNNLLQTGKKVHLFLRGYASPLSRGEYNKMLGNRRVDSVMNEFARYNGGVLKQYIQSGQLVLTERSLGETEAAEGVSDDPSSPRNSIYSPNASRERRIEIDEINEIIN